MLLNEHNDFRFNQRIRWIFVNEEESALQLTSILFALLYLITWLILD